MNTAVAILVASLLLVNTEGIPLAQTGRCLCIGAGVNFIMVKNIEKVQVYPASNSCDKMEIIVTLKGKAEQKCLNPESKFAKTFIQKYQRSKRLVSMMSEHRKTGNMNSGRLVRPALALLLTCMLFAYVKGVAIAPKGRCLCIEGGVNFVAPKNIQKLEIYAASSACSHMEIIITLKDGGEQKCLNPESKFAKNFIKNSQKSKRGLEKTA
ncbi:c-X-C motif chemokine 11-like [Arapaima gigas]